MVVTSVVILVACTTLRGAGGSKQWDRVMFVLAVAAAVGWCIRYLGGSPVRRVAPVWAVLAALALVVGSLWAERPGYARYFWEGFGISVTVVAVVVAATFSRILRAAQRWPAVRRVLTGAVVVLAVCDLLSLIRTLNDFVDAGNNVYMLNELLAPAAGRVPDATFVPQYVTLYGWPFVPFRHLMAPATLANAVVITLSCLSVAAVVLAVRVAGRALPPGHGWLAGLLVVPLVCVTVHHGVTLGDIGPLESSIGSFLQELPNRMFLAMVVTWTGLAELWRLRQGDLRRPALVALGVLGGLVAWNTQDLGIALVLVYAAVLWGAVGWAGAKPALAWWVAGVAIGFAAFPVAAALGGQRVDLADVGLLSRTYEGGFGSALVQFPGPAAFVLPVLLASAAVGWCLLWRQRGTAPDGDGARTFYAAQVLAFVGTWGLAGFVYYLNRSYASGQLQVLLLPCGVCLAALVGLGIETHQATRLGRRLSSRAFADLRRTGLLPVVVAASVAIAAVLQSPNPRVAVDALSHPHRQFSFSAYAGSLSVVRAAQGYVRHRGGSLGYFGENGSFVTLATGVPTDLLVDSPALSVVAPTIVDDTCNYLRDHGATWLVLSLGASQTYTHGVCGLYRVVQAEGLPPRTLYHRIGAP
ncbi:MAG TPA: hypothetical protein VMB72_16475 [Acidimicrobiales bacterium]|nr:hypothetical protein [Acidimicrobiales bacterium]